MNRSERFKPVQRLNESREQNAARALGYSVQTVQEQEKRLAELEQYRDEYNRQIELVGNTGVLASRLQEMQNFLHNLNQAIKQQQRIVELAYMEQEKNMSSWQQAHGKSRAVNKVVEKYRLEERHEENRREQKECDEHALNNSQRHKFLD